MNQELYHVSANPHVRDKVTTQNLMFYVILALLPTTIAGAYFFGMRALLVVLVSVISAMAGFIAAILLALRKKSLVTVALFSCTVVFVTERLLEMI